MTTYELSLESGPKHRTTMVHVFDLLGCVANGPTTEGALANTPDAIRAYLRLLARHGENVDPGAQFKTHVAEHITQGEWLGNGSPYIAFARDFEPVGDDELETLLRRFEAMRSELADWVRTQPDAALDATPQPKGRPPRAIILHVLGVPGAYLSAALGGAKGFSALGTQAERGLVPLDEALLTVARMVRERIAEATPGERARVVERPKDVRTLRKALRRTLEHDWEHLRELSRRPGGPQI